MDVVFGEDASRIAMEDAVENMALFRRFVMNIITQSQCDAPSQPGREHTNLKNEQLGQNASHSYKCHSYLEVKLSAIYSPVGCFMIESHICYLI